MDKNNFPVIESLENYPIVFVPLISFSGMSLKIRKCVKSILNALAAKC